MKSKFQIDKQNWCKKQSQLFNYNGTPPQMFSLKIYELLIGSSGYCPQKQSSTGNLENKCSE